MICPSETYPGVVDDGVAGLDRERGRKLVVPDIVDLILGEVVGLGHAANLLIVRLPDDTLSTRDDYFHPGAACGAR